MQIHESCHQNVAACSSNSGKKSCHQNVINILEGGPAALSTPSFPFYLGRSLNGVKVNDTFFQIIVLFHPLFLQIVINFLNNL